MSNRRVLRRRRIDALHCVIRQIYRIILIVSLRTSFDVVMTLYLQHMLVG